jgi:ParB family transcriptional regulator, chromosome partitioning protein
VTKDRRLGRGLAALLGTPLEEGAVGEGVSHASNASPEVGLAPVDRRPVAGTTRPETIRRLAEEAKASQAGASISPISIPMTPHSAPDESADGTATLDIAVNLIDPNPFQPRRQFNASEIESLAQSLKEHKQLQPILVRRVGDRYQLISGERRLRATVVACLPTIRAEVRVADDRLVAELAIIENLQRKDLNAIEKAMSFKRYITEHKCTQDELAQRLKIDRSSIANMMRLLELPDTITDAVQRDEISAGHAKALLSLGSIKEQIATLNKIRDEAWSVRETESRVAEMIAESAASEGGFLGAIPRRKPSKSDQLAALEKELKMSLGTRVDITQTSRGRGRITLHFTSIEEFDRLRQLLAHDLKRRVA